MKLRWGKKDDNDLGWWALFVMLAVMMVMFILKVLENI